MSTPDHAHFGRNANVEGPRRRLGLWSLLCAFLAFGLVIAALIFMVNLPNDASDLSTNIATTVLLVTYFLVAPVVHVTGVVLGVRGLSRGGESRFRCILGIGLNVALVGIGALLGMMAASGIGAFT